MSQENVEVVRNAFQTFGAEGVDAALSFRSEVSVRGTAGCRRR